MRFLLFPFIILNLSACGVELQNKDDSAPAVEIKILSEATLQIEVQGLPEPQKFAVHFTWPVTPGTVEIKRNGQSLGVLPGSQLHFQDTGFFGGQELHYEVIQKAGDGSIASQVPVKIRIPEDGVWNGDFMMTESRTYKFRRLFLLPGTQVTTLNFNLTIEAEEIYSDNGTLQNFKQETRAAKNTTGRSGGNISIKAVRAFGTLILVGRGEHGGHGYDAGTYQQAPFVGNGLSCSGTSGKAGGHSGNLTLHLADKSALKLYVSSFPGDGGLAGNAVRTKGARPVFGPLPTDCVHAARLTNGAPGKKGTVEVL